MSKRKRIHRSYPRYISNKPTCDDCGIPETMCVETDINGTYLSPPNLLFSIPSFKFDGVSMVPELNPLGELLDPQVLSFPNNELDNFDILEYSINIIEPVFKYTIVFTMSWRDSSEPQLANENYDSWVKRTSISFSNTHTQETPCAINDSVRTTLPANTIISGIINKSEIQAANEERIKRYFSSGLLGSPESIDISIRLSSEENTQSAYARKRCLHSVIYRGGTSECESPCRLVSAYSGVNGMGEIVSGSSGNCIVATSGLCASISGVWESSYCCPSPSPSGCSGCRSTITGLCLPGVVENNCSAQSGQWVSNCWADSSPVNMIMVTVGDPGNYADISPSPSPSPSIAPVYYGAVSYSYQIGKYEVTGSQYTAFLNAVAKTDPYRLYYEGWPSYYGATMYDNPRGAQIERTGSSPNYVYTVRNNTGNFPIAFARWWSCCRFCNWMSNGQPSGAQTSTTTEDGAYTIPDGRVGGPYIAANTINPNTGFSPTYRMPLENEWYKAAYYKGGSTNAGYWRYATQSDTNENATIGNTLIAVNVGTLTPSYYGTYDQSGNVWEYIEPNDFTQWSAQHSGDDSLTLHRGGRYYSDNPNIVDSSSRFDLNTQDSDPTKGFRVASSSSCTVPSPSVSPSPSPSPSVSPSPSPTLIATFYEGAYGTGVYGGTGVYSTLNCVQESDSFQFDDQYVYQLSMDNAGMVTYEYSIQSSGDFSLFELAGDKLSFESSSVTIAPSGILTITVRSSDSANSGSYIDTEVFIPICSG